MMQYYRHHHQYYYYYYYRGDNHGDRCNYYRYSQAVVWWLALLMVSISIIGGGTLTVPYHHHHHHDQLTVVFPNFMTVVSAASVGNSIHETMTLFRCNTNRNAAETTTTTGNSSSSSSSSSHNNNVNVNNNTATETCMYGAMSYMHTFTTTTTETNNCVESCVFFTGQLSRSQYHCGKCPVPPTTNTTTTTTTVVTYEPGNLIVEEAGLILSAGLTATIIATKDEPVQYADGTTSSPTVFHRYCDAGATFRDPRPDNIGGWIYVSNSEYRYKFDSTAQLGGVGAITFDHQGNVIHYAKILSNTTANCGGGKTPWNTWISCEEYETYGTCYEVDPTGGYYTRPPSIDYPINTNYYTGGHNISMTHLYRGLFESFAYDIAGTSSNSDDDDDDSPPQPPHFYVTKDDPAGEVRRFTPNMTRFYNNSTTPNHNDMWKESNFLSSPNNPYYHTVLTQGLTTGDDTDGGTLDFLVVVPEENDDDERPSRGTYYWTTNQQLGSDNGKMYFPNVEGIDVVGSTLYFISKVYYTMYMLDLTTMTYRNVTTQRGLFDGQPDQVEIVLHENSPTAVGNTQLPNTLHETISDHSVLLYFTEDTNRTAGIHGRTVQGDYLPILQSTVYQDETVGLAFSPNYQYMYMGYQTAGIVFQISRTDGLPFYGSTVNVKYHNSDDNPVDA